MRILLIERGRVAAFRPFAVGSRTSDLGSGRPAGADGIVALPEIDAGFVGFLSTVPYPGDLGRVSTINSTFALGIGRNADSRLFYAREDWGGGSPENCIIWAADARGLTITGNAMRVGRDDGQVGDFSPRFGIVYQRLSYSVIKNNVLADGALEKLIVDLHDHGQVVEVSDNVGCLCPNEGHRS